MPQSQAFGSNLFHEGPLGAGEGVALGREPPCVGVGTAGPGWNAGRRFGLPVPSAEGEHPGLQAGKGGRWLGMAGKALNTREGHCCYSSVAWWPLLGRTVSSGAPLYLPAAPPAFPGKRNWGVQSREARAKIPTALCKVFSLSTSTNLPETVTKESRERGAGTEVLFKMPSLCSST